MSQENVPLVDRGDAGRYVVDFQAGDMGPETPVACPKCSKELGHVPARAREEILCQVCGILYDVRGTQGGMALTDLRRLPIIEDTGLPSPGQVLNRPDIEIDIGWARRIMMVLWGLLMAGLTLVGLWWAVNFSG